MADKRPGYADQIIAKRLPAPAAEPPPPSNVTKIEIPDLPAPLAPKGDGEMVAETARRKRRVRLNLVFLDGQERSFHYMHLRDIIFDGSEIVIQHPDCDFRLKGRNLKKLKEHLDLEIQGNIQIVDPVVDKAATPPQEFAVYTITREPRKEED